MSKLEFFLWATVNAIRRNSYKTSVGEEMLYTVSVRSAIFIKLAAGRYSTKRAFLQNTVVF